LATLDWEQLGARFGAAQRALEAVGGRSAVPLVMNAWFHIGAAGVTLELIDNVEDPDRRRALAELFTAQQDLLDFTAFSLGTRSVVTALDLCAAVVWRLSGGQPLRGGKESDVDHAFGSRSKLAPGPLLDWLVGSTTAPSTPRSRSPATASRTARSAATPPCWSARGARCSSRRWVAHGRPPRRTYAWQSPSPSTSSRRSATQPARRSKGSCGRGCQAGGKILSYGLLGGCLGQRNWQRLQLVGVATVAADLIHHGRVPDVRECSDGCFGGRAPSTGKGPRTPPCGLRPRRRASPVRVEIGRGGIQEQLLELERRIGEVQASVEREGRSRAEAIARLEHATQAQMQSLQNELTALRHDLARNRERVRSRAGIGWAGIAGFSLGLILNIVGSFMAVGCSS
jgi:hypothetical protein